jgi:hypothetical protein
MASTHAFVSGRICLHSNSAKRSVTIISGSKRKIDFSGVISGPRMPSRHEVVQGKFPGRRGSLALICCAKMPTYVVKIDPYLYHWYSRSIAKKNT